MSPAPPRFRILLADDEPVIRELVAAMLEADGVEVRCVRDGNEAIRAAQYAKPDLVLLDVVLPGLDGFAVCRLLRANPALLAVPIYMLTAKAKAADHEAARKAGASGYIQKPFKAQELQELVAALRKASRPT
jgi:two-component system, OmpR family, phosphate regulon response regulator PhoB